MPKPSMRISSGNGHELILFEDRRWQDCHFGETVVEGAPHAFEI
jgi:hypothetical protein